jgi:hypothetical protein
MDNIIEIAYQQGLADGEDRAVFFITHGKDPQQYGPDYTGGFLEFGGHTDEWTAYRNGYSDGFNQYGG